MPGGTPDGAGSVRPVEDTGPFELGGVKVDPVTMTGRRDRESFPLTQRELKLLRYFRVHRGAVLHRQTLLNEIWGQYYDGTTRTLDQHIAKLRRKIEEKPAHPRHIVTVHGVGYKYEG